MEPEGSPSVSSYLMKLVNLTERQVKSIQELDQHLRNAMARADAKFVQVAEAFLQLDGWLRRQNDHIVGMNDRMAGFTERMADSTERMALTDERIANLMDRMVLNDQRFLEVGERLDRLERQIEELLRALLRGRGDGEGMS